MSENVTKLSCRHGLLKRSCGWCESEEEIAELEATLTARESELAEANERLRVTAGALVKMESELAEAKVELQDAYDVCAKLDADCREAKRRVAELEAKDRITHIPGKESDDGEMH